MFILSRYVQKYLILIAFLLGDIQLVLNIVFCNIFSMKNSQMHSCDRCKFYVDFQDKLDKS